ncbi:ABC transporter permease [Candidatus Avoscillospira sp. LCP25S3_F1]|uniref:ABC transporter permease n=1 Tax=Candidatus Avoscillospira sp. LCP25S3_F1 TaxID=3438825 RepID=UPI003F8DACEF
MQKKLNPMQRFLAIRGIASVLTAFAGVIVLMIIFSILNPNFAKPNSLLTLARSVIPFLLVGIGQAYVCITGNIDLSIGSVLGMSAMISATMMCNGSHPVVAVLVAFLACMLTGFINGLLVGKFKLPPFIGTLGTMTIARGVAQLANGNYNTDNIGSEGAAQMFKDILYYGKTLGLYNGVWIGLIVWAIFFYLLTFTRSGRHIYAIGSNVDAARLSGVNVFATTTKAYMVSSFCAFLTGLIIMAQSGMGDMSAGTSYEMYAVAAAVIGGVSTLGGSGLLVGVIAGASVWAILQSGLTFANVPVAFRNIIIGLIVVACVLFDVLRRDSKKPVKKEKKQTSKAA